MTVKMIYTTVAAFLVIVTIAGPCMAFPVAVIAKPLAGFWKAGIKIVISGLARGLSLVKKSTRIFSCLAGKMKSAGSKVPGILPWICCPKKPTKPSIVKSGIELLKRYWKLILMAVGIGYVKSVDTPSILLICQVFIIFVLIFLFWPFYSWIIREIFKMVTFSKKNKNTEEDRNSSLKESVFGVLANIKTLLIIFLNLFSSLASLCRNLMNAKPSDETVADEPSLMENEEHLPEDM